MSKDSACFGKEWPRNPGISGFPTFAWWPTCLGCLVWPTCLGCQTQHPVSSCRVTLHALWGWLWESGIGNQNQKVKVKSFKRKVRMYNISPTHKNSKTERPARYQMLISVLLGVLKMRKEELYSNAKIIIFILFLIFGEQGARNSCWGGSTHSARYYGPRRPLCSFVR